MTDCRRTRREVLGAMATCTLAPAFVRAGAPEGLLFRDVRLVDGTGATARQADVLVRGGRIERIGKTGSTTAWR